MPIIPGAYMILTSKHRFVTVRLCARYSMSAYLALTYGYRNDDDDAKRDPFAAGVPDRVRE